MTKTETRYEKACRIVAAEFSDEDWQFKGTDTWTFPTPHTQNYSAVLGIGVRNLCSKIGISFDKLDLKSIGQKEVRSGSVYDTKFLTDVYKKNDALEAILCQLPSLLDQPG